MEPQEFNALVESLVVDPSNPETLQRAEDLGREDPRSYVALLETVASECTENRVRCHWLTEASHTLRGTLGDPKRATYLSKVAVKADPENDAAADLLETLCWEAGDADALEAFLESRADALLTIATEDPSRAPQAAKGAQKLGQQLAGTTGNKLRALAAFKQASKLDPLWPEPVRAARELYAESGQYADAIALIEIESGLAGDAAARIALLREQARLSEKAGDPRAASAALRRALALEPNDLELAEELAESIRSRALAGEDLAEDERTDAVRVYRSMAETFAEERDLAFGYARGLLDVRPGEDSAMLLALKHAQELERRAELLPNLERHIHEHADSAITRVVRKELAKLYAGSGRNDDAIQVLMPYAELDGEMEQHVCELYDRTGRYEELVERVERRARSFAPKRRAQTLQELAELLVERGRSDDASLQYRALLELDPSDDKALGWIDAYLRHEQRYAELQELLVTLASPSGLPAAVRAARLWAAARLAESQLDDTDRAVDALSALLGLDPNDFEAAQNIERLLERSARWADLSNLLQSRIEHLEDDRAKLASLEKIARIEELKLERPAGAAAAWEQIARLAPGDGTPLSTSVKLYEQAGEPARAANTIAEHVELVKNKAARTRLYRRLGEIQEQAEQFALAGAAHAAAAALTGGAKSWESAERCFIQANLFGQAASAAAQLTELEKKPPARAKRLFYEAMLWERSGDSVTARARLEAAVELDPALDDAAEELARRYAASDEQAKVVKLLLRRAKNCADPAKAVTLMRRAAAIQADELRSPAAAAATLEDALAHGEDPDILLWLADHFDAQREGLKASEYLRRRVAALPEGPERTSSALREARLVADLGDLEGAIERYEGILRDSDPENRVALAALAELEEKRGNFAGVAEALARALELAHTSSERLSVGMRLAGVYEGPLADVPKAIEAYELVRRIDREHPVVTDRLVNLCMGAGRFERAAALLTEAIGLCRDAARHSSLARELSSLMHEKLDRAPEALRVLLGPAASGDAACRDAFVLLGDRLGSGLEVAQKLFEWHAPGQPSDARDTALRGAFDRFLAFSSLERATEVAVLLADGPRDDAHPAHRLEAAAFEARHPAVLRIAHELRERGLPDVERCLELVRQAEVLVTVGMPADEAIRHGERGLDVCGPEGAEALLERLARLDAAPASVIGLYERQVGRCGEGPERIRALIRAAEIAARHGAFDRTRALFESAVRGSVPRELLLLLEATAARVDEQLGGTGVRRALSEALAEGGLSAVDAGRSRSELLRRAALIAHRDLDDSALAFEWLGEAVFVRLDAALAEALGTLRAQTAEMRAAAELVQRALAERERASFPSAAQWSDKGERPQMRSSVPAAPQAAQSTAPRARAQRADAVTLPRPPRVPDDARGGAPFERAPRPPESGITDVSEYLRPEPADPNDPQARSAEPVVRPRRAASVPPPPPPRAAGSVRPSVPPRPASPAIVPASQPRSERPRARGDELLPSLLESLKELAYLADPIEGADLVLRVLMNSLSAEIGVVHLYDINNREFVAIRALGRDSAKLVMARSKDSEPLAVEAFKKRRALLVMDAQRDPRLSSTRWSAIVGLRTLLCAPAHRDGRPFGLIEVANPTEKPIFDDVELSAATRVAEQFGHFIAERSLHGGETPR